MAKTILVVDDEKLIVRLMQTSLEQAGYRVLTAADGSEVPGCIAQERPDLIVLDIKMPHVGGREALKRLREDPDTCDLPIIMLTDVPGDADVFWGHSIGVDCYLTKPFHPMELISCVRHIFRAQEEVPANEPENLT